MKTCNLLKASGLSAEDDHIFILEEKGCISPAVSCEYASLPSYAAVNEISPSALRRNALRSEVGAEIAKIWDFILGISSSARSLVQFRAVGFSLNLSPTLLVQTSLSNQYLRFVNTSQRREIQLTSLLRHFATFAKNSLVSFAFHIAGWTAKIWTDEIYIDVLVELWIELRRRISLKIRPLCVFSDLLMINLPSYHLKVRLSVRDRAEDGWSGVERCGIDRYLGHEMLQV